MYEKLDLPEDRSFEEMRKARPPSLLNALTELPRTLLDISALCLSMPLLANMPRGDGHPVMVLPGFMASDSSTAVLRRYLRQLGYKPMGWGLGRNNGRFEIIQQTLIEQFLEVAETCDDKITLIGQSLGGVYARELARFYPDKVRQVITLGSPFGVLNGTAANPFVRRLFETQSGLSIEKMREAIFEIDPHKTPPVPLTAIYSKGDGVVNWRVCREAFEDFETDNIQVLGAHCGMGFNAAIYGIIADRLSQPVDNWRKFERCKLNNFGGTSKMGNRELKTATKR
ncbi:MAG: pimeloyl-ACP methyl ester carboxylesterase [Candidatus Azotimanducaceae bacterium]